VVDYTETPLWQSTLAPQRRDDHAVQRERLRNAYQVLRANAIPLLAEAARSTPNFTVHDISHVDALWETASLVCVDPMTMTPAEAFVLGCAFVLHDAAMGVAAYRDGLVKNIGEDRWRDLLAVEFHRQRDRWPQPEELDHPAVEVVDQAMVQAIREGHAAQAKRLVDTPWTSSAGSPLFLLDDVHLREKYGPLIGDLAASHWWDVDSLPNHFKHGIGSLTEQPAAWKVDALRLACVLRLADATQIDSRRSPTFLFALRDPRGASRNHWLFQEHVSRPDLVGDRIKYTALRSFRRDEADAWWLALDYLREVDRELKRVDALMFDLGRSQFAARAVAGVESPERFADLFRLDGWQPVDGTLQVSDVPALVQALGGEQLYGNEPEVAIRELIQNAHDAVTARMAITPGWMDGSIQVKFFREDDDWIFEILDNGIGMDDGIIRSSLLDFGRSGWDSDDIRKKFPGLSGGDFQPRGRFGIGFFSVFMLGDVVEVTTRRFDGSTADARTVCFNGLDRRAIIATPTNPIQTPIGTTVRVRLTKLKMRNKPQNFLRKIVQTFVIENVVPIGVVDNDGQTYMHEPLDLATTGAAELFDRLTAEPYYVYISNDIAGRIMRDRDAFVERATPLFDAVGRRIGLAAFASQEIHKGVITADGFRASDRGNFIGCLKGLPSRVSRESADAIVTGSSVHDWLVSQERRIREIGQFGTDTQLELSQTMYTLLGTLSSDYAVARVEGGVVRFGEMVDWALGYDEIFIVYWGVIDMAYLDGLPRDHGLEKLRDNWIMPAKHFIGTPFAELLGRRHGQIEDALMAAIGTAWSCEVASLAEARNGDWQGYVVGDQREEPVHGYRLRRPEPR
jgi:histidine kinase/DNA gyrase B/HSP90-like ATPase